MGGFAWTEDEDTQLRNLVRNGVAGTDVMPLFPGRSESAIWSRIYSLGLAIRRHKPQKRLMKPPPRGHVADLPPELLQPLEKEALRHGVTVMEIIKRRLLSASSRTV